MAETPTAYPLAWPIAWRRTPADQREKPPFFKGGTGDWRDSTRTMQRSLTLAEARARLQRELDLLLGRDADVVLSTNVQLRLDGAPRSGQAEPKDPGVAVYFRLSGRPTVLACDRWNSVPGNIAALAAHIGALRGMDRWGVGSVEQAFTGYMALPAPMVPDDWRAVLGEPRTLAEAEETWRRLMRTAHPDAGGSEAEAARLNAAIARARVELRT